MQPGSSRLFATTSENARSAVSRSAGSKSIQPVTMTGRSSWVAIWRTSSPSGVEHLLHDPVEVRDLAFVVVEDVPGVRGGPLRRADLLVDLHVLGDDVLQPVPVRGHSGDVVLVALRVVL